MVGQSVVEEGVAAVQLGGQVMEARTGEAQGHLGICLGIRVRFAHSVGRQRSLANVGGAEDQRTVMERSAARAQRNAFL